MRATRRCRAGPRRSSARPDPSPLDPEGAAAGFHALPPLAATAAIEVTRTGTTSGLAAERLETFVTAIGRHAEPVGDAPASCSAASSASS
ncbi:MAG: hypothetical protein U0R70_06230 [Solirubrobacteraceae bacterium]